MKYTTSVEVIENGQVTTTNGKRKHTEDVKDAINNPIDDVLTAALKDNRPGDIFDVTVTVTKRNKRQR